MENKEVGRDCSCIHLEKANGAMQSLGEVKSFNMLSDFFKTFADDTRLKIICVLDSQKEMCVCDIAYSINMTKSAISHQLKFLKEGGLVVTRKKGKVVFYSLADDHVKDIFELGIAHMEDM